MNKYVITASTTCDLTIEQLKKMNIEYACFNYYINDKKYVDDFYTTFSKKDFFDEIKSSEVKTSQPEPESYVNMWEKIINDDNDVLHIELSSGISGAVNSANIAKRLIEEKIANGKLPNKKVIVIDSLCASVGYGLLVQFAYIKKEENVDIDTLYDYVENLKHNINTIFFVPNLDQLVKGGRVSKLAGNIAKALGIVPILHVDKNGKLAVIKKVRGTSNAIDEIIKLSTKNIIDKENYDKYFYIGNANDLETAKILKNKILEKYKNAKLCDDNIYDVGTVIACHTGAGCIVMCYLGEDGRI